MEGNCVDRAITGKELLETKKLPFSRSTLGREVRAARAGLSNFPLPLREKGKILVFSLRSIENWLAQHQVLKDIVPPETPTAREARCKAARQELQRLGIKTSTKQERGRMNG